MRKFFLLLVSFCLVGCMSETFQGQSKVETSSLSWIPFKGGENISFINSNPNAENISMLYQVGKRQSVFNNITDCHNLNVFQEKCDVYSMECNFVTATSLDKKSTITYSVERGQKEGKFYDELQIKVKTYGKAEATMRFQVFNETNDLAKDCQFNDKISLGEKSFTDVYMKNDGNQVIYFSKERGIVAFGADNDNLWVRM